MFDCAFSQEEFEIAGLLSLFVYGRLSCLDNSGVFLY